MPTQKKRPTKKRKPRRTSDRVSSFAADVLNRMRQDRLIHGKLRSACTYVEPHELAALAASCLAQDEHRGPRETKGRK